MTANDNAILSDILAELKAIRVLLEPPKRYGLWISDESGWVDNGRGEPILGTLGEMTEKVKSRAFQMHNPHLRNSTIRIFPD